MADPSRFDEMINWAFATATGIYVLLGVVGYIMFGNAVSDEVSSIVALSSQPLLKRLYSSVWTLWNITSTPR